MGPARWRRTGSGRGRGHLVLRRRIPGVPRRGGDPRREPRSAARGETQDVVAQMLDPEVGRSAHAGEVTVMSVEEYRSPPPTEGASEAGRAPHSGCVFGPTSTPGDRVSRPGGRLASPSVHGRRRSLAHSCRRSFEWSRSLSRHRARPARRADGAPGSPAAAARGRSERGWSGDARHHVDVTDAESCRSAIQEAAEGLGGIDALVYSPGSGPSPVSSTPTP